MFVSYPESSRRLNNLDQQIQNPSKAVAADAR